MKKFKTLASVVLVMMMILSMMVPVMAQTVGTATTGTGTITISNAAKGETYSVYKLFDASVTGTAGGSIAYTGTIPESLKDYFEADTAGNISVKDGVDEDDLFDALGTWAATATATASAECDGTTLVFAGLAYGYYVVTTTQGDAAITVTSTNPNAEIVDKNSTTAVDSLTKTVDTDNVSFGNTVTYTVKFKTSNYYGAGTAAKKVVSYTIEDTLPAFLSNVTVTSIKVGGTAIATQQFDSDKKIVIDWYSDGAFLYANGAEVEITYTAVVTESAAIRTANTNTVTVTPNLEGDTNGEAKTASDDIYTYDFQIKKVDGSGNVLAGATFKLPFYVKATTTANTYNYAGTVAGEGLVNEVTTDSTGLIKINGVASATYSIEETKAPAGYNMLTEAKSVTVSTTETVTLEVVNNAGTELPSTGGIGTTIFYCVGGIMAVGAFVLLITKKRMNRGM